MQDTESAPKAAATPTVIAIAGLLLATLLAPLTGTGQPVERVPAAENGLDLKCWQPDPAWLDCDYRLMSPAADVEITAMAETIALAPPKVMPYPYEGAASSVLFLVDTSDPGRQPVIEHNIRHIRQLLQAGRPHHRFGLATFDSELRVEAPIGSTPEAITHRLSSIRATGKTTELYRSALLAVQLLATQIADRRALFLFSDGLAEDRAYFHQDVIEAAHKGGVVIYGLGYAQSTGLSVALQTLRRLSEETGGVFVEADPRGELPASFLAAPYAVLDNGGRLDIDLSPAIEAGLTGPRNIQIAINVGNRVISKNVGVKLPPPAPPVAAAKPVPEATPESAAPLLPAPMDVAQTPSAAPPSLSSTPSPEPIPLGGKGPSVLLYLGLGLGVLFLLLGLLWFLYRRRNGAGKNAEGEGPYAYLAFRDEPGRERVAINTSSIRIGRHPDNDLQLDDPSVSRHHAEIHRQRDGSFTITDLDSLNGIYVNDRQVKSSGLGEGDELEIGDLRLLFTLYKGVSPAEEKTVMNMDKTIVSRTHHPFMEEGAR